MKIIGLTRRHREYLVIGNDPESLVSVKSAFKVQYSLTIIHTYTLCKRYRISDGD